MNDVFGIEGATPLDDLSGLKIKIPHITRRQLYEAEAQNIAKVSYKYLVRSGYAKRAAFDVDWVCALHLEMYGQVWQWAGAYRKTQTNIGSAPACIHQDLLILMKDVAGWCDIGMDILEQAVRLHHRSVQIHPFQNGNGRWSRMISNIWLKKNDESIVRWPDDLDISTQIRSGYLLALRQADHSDYHALL